MNGEGFRGFCCEYFQLNSPKGDLAFIIVVQYSACPFLIDTSVYFIILKILWRNFEFIFPGENRFDIRHSDNKGFQL